MELTESIWEAIPSTTAPSPGPPRALHQGTCLAGWGAETLPCAPEAFCQADRTHPRGALL